MTDEKSGASKGYSPPIAEVLSSEKEGAVLRTAVRLDWIPSPPLAPATLLSSHDGSSFFVHRTVARQGNEFTFETYDAEAKPLIRGSAYLLQSWWGSSQLALAQDSSREWQRQEFEQEDAVEFRTRDGRRWFRRLQDGDQVTDGVWVTGRRPLAAPGGKPYADDDFVSIELVSGGWDHEHCALCWRIIGAEQGEEPFGYTDGHDWLCETCHQQFVASGFGRKLGDQV